MSEYINLETGSNTVWLTAVKFDRGTNDKPKPHFILTACEQPTAVTHTGAFTNVKIYVPTSEDSVPARILKEKKIKDTIYPLCGLKQEDSSSIKQLFDILKQTFEGYDVQANLIVENREGKGVDRNGNTIVFSDVIRIEPLATGEKKAYESSISDEMPDME